MKTKLLLFTFLFVASFANVIKAQTNIGDSLALVDLYNSTNGPNWNYHTKWLTKAPVSQWHGISVAGTRVTNIYLADNALAGSLPASIGNLDGLQYLDLFRNQLTGSIPASVGKLTSLINIDLFDNQLSGSIPASIGNLANLNFLYLNSNQLSGNIPESVGNLLSLSNISLANNQLSGVIPASLGNLTKLNYLALAYNQLSGNIPVSLANTQLMNVYLNNNQLSGDLSAVAKLKLLNYLNISHNNMSGNIYPVSKLKNLYYINLSYNRFNGEIPQALKNLTDLYFIDVSNNQLTKSDNVYFSQKHKGITVNVSYNKLTFDGLESLVQKFKHLIYSPQASIPVHSYKNGLATTAGGTLSNNIYKWFKTGNSNPVTIAGDSTFMPAQSGQYYALVTNSIVVGLTLQTDTISYTIPVINNPLTIIVYPNPAKDFIIITGLNNRSNASITIAGMSGDAYLRVMSAKRATVKCNVSRLKTGNYLVAVNDGKEIRAVQFIKE